MKFLYLIPILATSVIWQKENLCAENSNADDSVKYVANRLLDYDVYINSYTVSDAELDWIENEHPNWISDYFPCILTQYDCTLYSKFAIAASLYKRGKPHYLCSLWDNFGYLFEVDGKRSGESMIKQIWNLLDWLKINPHEIKRQKENV